jgi:hypothetical protein
MRINATAMRICMCEYHDGAYICENHGFHTYFHMWFSHIYTKSSSYTEREREREREREKHTLTRYVHACQERSQENHHPTHAHTHTLTHMFPSTQALLAILTRMPDGMCLQVKSEAKKIIESAKKNRTDLEVVAHACIHTHTHTHTRAHAHSPTHTHLYMRVYYHFLKNHQIREEKPHWPRGCHTCVHACTHTHTHIYTCVYTIISSKIIKSAIEVVTHACMHAHTHFCTCSLIIIAFMCRYSFLSHGDILIPFTLYMLMYVHSLHVCRRHKRT